MDKPTFDRSIQQLLPEMAARPFTVRLIRLLDEFGELDDGTPALVALLEEMKRQVGETRQKTIDELIGIIATPAPAPPEISLPREKIDEELYVFISYARPEAPIAEQIEAYLTAAGVRVFRDVTSIILFYP